MIKETAEGIILTVRVQPKSSKNRHECMEEAIKIWVNAPPVEGKANEAVIAYLSKLLGVKKSSFYIVSGEKSRNKKILIKGVDKALVAEKLGC